MEINVEPLRSKPHYGKLLLLIVVSVAFIVALSSLAAMVFNTSLGIVVLFATLIVSPIAEAIWRLVIKPGLNTQNG